MAVGGRCAIGANSDAASRRKLLAILPWVARSSGERKMRLLESGLGRCGPSQSVIRYSLDIAHFAYRSTYRLAGNRAAEYRWLRYRIVLLHILQ